MWFSFTSEGYLTNTATEERIHASLPEQYIMPVGTLHIWKCRQQDSLAACQPWLMWSLSKAGEIHQRNFWEKAWQKPPQLLWTRMWLIQCFPSVPSHLRGFVSQELWDLSLLRKLILQQTQPVLHTPFQPSTARVHVRAWSADTTE